MKSRVVIICSSAHREVWKLTSRLLPRFVPSESYEVFVPDAEIDEFKRNTPAPILVKSQDRLGARFKTELREAVDRAGQAKRFGWYWQQFLKIEALRIESFDASIIWDSDCVPASRQEFFSEAGHVRFMRGKEFHSPYFQAISRLLGLKRQVDFSFVTPGFPYLSEWSRDFVAEIEARHATPWHNAVIQSVDFREKSGFSETETLGTFMAAHRPKAWSLFPVAWERYGHSRFGHPSSFSAEKFVELAEKHRLDVISFENWDTKSKDARNSHSGRSFFARVKARGIQPR